MLAVVAVFAFALFGSNLAQWLVDGYKASCRQRLKQKEQDKEEAKQERLRAEYRQQVLGYLDTLSEVEREILSFLVQKNQQSFTADMAGKLIATLKQKGLVEMGPGVHTQLDWPFTVPNFVWEELMRRKEDFNIADLEGRVPWREQW